MTYEKAREVMQKDSNCINMPCGTKNCLECDLHVSMHDRLEAMQAIWKRLQELEKEKGVVESEGD